MNNCTFAGRLGGDAETRFTQAGKPVTNFSLAVDEYAGQGERKTLWVKCAVWGERGEKLAQYLVKGTPVCVSGQSGIETYTANDGSAKANLTLFVREVTLLGSRQDGQPTQPRQQAPAQRQASVDDFDDQSIPF